MMKEAEEKRLAAELPLNSPRSNRERSVTGGGPSVGTPFFMAPELFESSDSGVMDKLVQPGEEVHHPN